MQKFFFVIATWVLSASAVYAADCGSRDRCFQNPPIIASFDPPTPAQIAEHTARYRENCLREYDQCVAKAEEEYTAEQKNQEQALLDQIAKGQDPNQTEFGDCLYRCALSNPNNPNACIGYCVNGSWGGGAQGTAGLLPTSPSNLSQGPGLPAILVPRLTTTIPPDLQPPRSLPNWDGACVQNAGNPLCSYIP